MMYFYSLGSFRNVSAEIFVVCRNFLAPKHIDPKFFDPKHVFKDLSANAPIEDISKQTAAQAQVNVFQPEKKRRKRDGYADGDYILYKEAGAAEFIKGDDAVGFLGTKNRITFKTDEEKEWLKMDITTEDVKANCEDLKVLGKGDFKVLMKWRTALREEVRYSGNSVSVDGLDFPRLAWPRCQDERYRGDHRDRRSHGRGG